MQDGLREEEVRAVGIVHEQGDSLLPARRGKRGDVRQLPVIIRAGHIGRPHIGVQCHRVHEVLRKRPDGFQAQQRHGIHRGAVYHAAAQDLPPVRRGQAQHRLDTQRAPARGEQRPLCAKELRGGLLRAQDGAFGFKEAVGVRQLGKIEG